MADTNTYVSKQKVEKWTTKEKFNAFDLSTIETGTEYNLTGAIEESDLDSDLQTKINGKLTAPTTPTADSAVTMLADGTVGTKPLTEIGGKLYNHSIYYFISETDLSVYINVITSSSTPFTQFSEFNSLIENKVASITGPEFCGTAVVTTADGDKVWIRGGGVDGYNATNYATIDKKLDSSSFRRDTVTEL